MSRQVRNKSIKREAQDLLNEILLEEVSCSDPITNKKNDDGYVADETFEKLNNLLKQNKTLMEQNKVIIEHNKTLIQENNKLRQNNENIYRSFTEEFIALRRTIEQSLQMHNAQNILNSKLSCLPCKTVQNVIDFEKALLDDDEMVLELIAQFNKQSTDSIKNYIGQNLKAIFVNDEITSKFAWTNANNNIAVRNYKFIRLLKDSCMEIIPQTNYSMIEDVIKKYFNTVKDRNTKSLTRRREKKYNKLNIN